MSISRLRISLVALALLGGAASAQVGPSDSAPAAPAISAPDQQPLPPIVSFMRSSSGWSANFSFADPVTEIQWSTAKDGPFESTGFLTSYDPLTRRPAANSGVELDGIAPGIYVRYADLQGNWIGPFAAPFGRCWKARLISKWSARPRTANKPLPWPKSSIPTWS